MTSRSSGGWAQGFCEKQSDGKRKSINYSEKLRDIVYLTSPKLQVIFTFLATAKLYSVSWDAMKTVESRHPAFLKNVFSVFIYFNGRHITLTC